MKSGQVPANLLIGNTNATNKNATDGDKKATEDGPTDMEQVVKYHNKLGVSNLFMFLQSIDPFI